MPKSISARAIALAAGLCAVALTAFPSLAMGGSGGVGAGGSGTQDAGTTVGSRAKLLKSGLAQAPVDAPLEVQRAIAAGNAIDDAGYCSGGGHGNWNSRCYDCSGAVSYILGPKGAGILEDPLPSGDFLKWGERRKGDWITVYYNAGHAFVSVAGLRFDTSLPDDGEEGPGWSKDVKAGLVNGPFRKRHYLGL